MKNKKVSIVFVSAAIMLSSCAMAAPEMESASDAVGGMAAPAEAPRMESMEMDEVFVEEAAIDAEFSKDSTDFSTDGSAEAERIVIKNADLSIVVANPADAMDAISEMAEGMGGFVVNSNLYKTTTSQGLEVPNANITVRVPADQLESALDQIKALVADPAIDIVNENVTGQDVTDQVTDLESRLRNLQAAEEQLLQIMEDAYKTEDVLSIFRELTSVREEIEVIQGQIKYFRESARLSAISVTLQAKAAVEPITVGGWQLGVEAQRAIQALVNSGEMLATALLWLLLYALPILAIIFLPIFFIVRAIRNRRMKKTGKQESAKKEKEKEKEK